MTKFTEHAIGQRRGSSVNSEYISDVMKNSNSFVPKDLSSGYRENRKTGKLELVTETSDPEKEYETKCENKICFGTFNSNNNTNTIDLLVKVNKKERLGDFQLTQRSAFAIRDMVKRFDFETQESLRWKGEWNANAKTFTMNKEDKEDKEEEKVQMENGGVVRTAGIAECSYDYETKETRVYFSEEDTHRRLTNKHELIGQCANAIEFLKQVSEIELERKEENIITLTLETHGVAEDIGADLIAAKLRAEKEKKVLLVKSETAEETAQRMAKERNEVKASGGDAVKFATSSEKRKGDGANKGDVGDDDDAYDDDEKKRKKKKKKMSRFEESDDSDSD